MWERKYFLVQLLKLKGKILEKLSKYRFSVTSWYRGACKVGLEPINY
jgi:hypothetical protein|tara:strand:+ start:301 stop:441 length:141 start_codon:yes stop_codon:yes gene_type:complete